MLPLKQYPFIMVASGVNWQKVNPKLLADLNKLARTRGQLVEITSGYRTRAQQAALYERYKASGFNIRYIAAKPGESNHESGNAIDVTVGGTPLALAVKPSELATYGLSTPVKGDPEHTELLGSALPVASTVAPTADTPPAAAPADTSAQLAPPALGTPPAAPDPSVEMPGTAQHFLPGTTGADSWQSIAALPDLSPDTQRLIQLSSGG